MFFEDGGIQPMPAISIILPTYNRAYVLGRAIRSILNQTFQDFELIIIDDNSKDGTEELVRSIVSEKIKYVCQKEKTSPAIARNRGIQLAKGRYIAFQDSDDEWMPDKLERQFADLEKAPPEVGVSCSGFYRVINNVKTYMSPASVIRTEGKIFSSLLKRPYGWPQTVLVKRECFDKAGLFDEHFNVWEDYELLLRLSKCYDFKYIDEPLVIIYPQPDSVSQNQNTYITASRQLLEKYFEDIRQDKGLLRWYYFRIGDLLCHDGKLKEGRGYFLKSIEENPKDLKAACAFLLSFSGKLIYNVVANAHGQIVKSFQRI